MGSPLMIILLFIPLLPFAISQNPSSQTPTMANCASSLIPLTPCAPYVRGAVRSPAQVCCDNVKSVYRQHSGCLCLFLNSTASSSNNIPINRTLALQLPVVCDFQADISTCSGVAGPPKVALGSDNNSIIVASPVVDPGAPRPSIPFGLDTSAGLNSNKNGELGFLIMANVIAFQFIFIAIDLIILP